MGDGSRDSEWRVREISQELTRDCYQLMMQGKVDAHAVSSQAGRLCQYLLTLGAMLLDFYHLSQHVYDAAKCCLGDTPAAHEWARDRLNEFKELGVTPPLAAIDLLMKKLRSEAKRKSLRLLRDYIVQRIRMVDYRTALAKGWDIGSGPTEAMCKNLTLRLKRTGMKWDPDHAAAMMNLTALYESGQAKAYWNARAAA